MCGSNIPGLARHIINTALEEALIAGPPVAPHDSHLFEGKLRGRAQTGGQRGVGNRHSSSVLAGGTEVEVERPAAPNSTRQLRR